MSQASDSIGRAYVKALYSQIHKPMLNDVISEWLRTSLHLWLEYMEERPTSTHRNWQDRSHCKMWVDASGSKRIIAVIIEVEGVLHYTNLQV